LAGTKFQALLSRTNVLAGVELDSFHRPKSKSVTLDAGGLPFCAVLALIAVPQLNAYIT
jgi:hypothetical protein